MKHKFLRKNPDNSWLIYCPLQETTFSSALWRGGKVKHQICPSCNNSVEEDLITKENHVIQDTLLNQLQKIAENKNKTLNQVINIALKQFLILENTTQEAIKQIEL